MILTSFRGSRLVSGAGLRDFCAAAHAPAIDAQFLMHNFRRFTGAYVPGLSSAGPGAAVKR
jgi:hypothetical protein